MGRQLLTFVTSSAMVAIGCCQGCSSRPAAVKPPSFDPQSFADSILQRCDSDGSGSLSKKEAEQAPGLVSRWSRYDKDKDNSITRAELEARIQEWVDRGDGIASVNCVVRLKNRQIGDVQIRLIPDESLKDVIHPAETVSHAKYASFLSIPAELKPAAQQKLAGMQYGLYTIEVSHPTMKLVPAANSRGVDIGPSDQASPVKIEVEQR